MRQKTVLTGLVAAQLSLLIIGSWSLPVAAQTVGDPFIDTSEWVQSSSPIRDNGQVRGYITETIVRGYRGPSDGPYNNPSPYANDPYYAASRVQSAVEFSQESKIQPVVYENSGGGDSTSLEPPLRPTPDPVVQAANRNEGSPTHPSGLRGFATPASYQQPVASQRPYAGTPNQQPYGVMPPVNPPAEGMGTSSLAPVNHAVNPAQGSYRPAPVIHTSTFQGSYPAIQHSLATTGYVATQYSTPPAAAYSATLTNCCDPIYAQTQFVAPNMNTGPGGLQTYPQYGGNPYPNPGYSISQPYVRDTWVPMIPLRSMPYGTYLGQGIIGQPVAYVDGEPVRNFLRYIFP